MRSDVTARSPPVAVCAMLETKLRSGSDRGPTLVEEKRS
jgi:hypothetical protein